MKINPLIKYVNLKVLSAEYRPALVHQMLTGYKALGHTGTKKQKMRGEVSGGNKKPHRQKGTGRARAGSTRGPLWRTGGVTFAARGLPCRKVKLNRKMLREAVKSILSELYRNSEMQVFENLEVNTPKTKDFLKTYPVVNRTLIVVKELSENLIMATRNLYEVNVIDQSEVNPSVLLGNRAVYIESAALMSLEERL